MKTLILTLLLLLIPVGVHAQEIKVEYFRFEDHTLVTTPPVKVFGDENGLTHRSLTLGAAYGFPGKTPLLPTRIQLTLTSTSLKAIFLDETGIIILADGKRYPLKAKAKTSHVVETYERLTPVYISEFLVFDVPTEVYREITGSKSVEIKASIYEVKLTEDQLGVFKAILTKFADSK